MKTLIPAVLVAASLFGAAPLNCSAEDATPTPALNSQAPSAPVLLAQHDVASTSVASTESTTAATTAASTESATTAGGFDGGRRDARLAAAKGPEALRRYIDRTRMIYALTFDAFLTDK
jgi:hypothetical protein